MKWIKKKSTFVFDDNELDDLRYVLQEHDISGGSVVKGRWGIARGGYDCEFQITLDGIPVIESVDHELCHISNHIGEGAFVQACHAIVSTYTNLKSNAPAPERESRAAALSIRTDNSMPVYYTDEAYRRAIRKMTKEYVNLVLDQLDDISETAHVFGLRSFRPLEMSDKEVADACVDAMLLDNVSITEIEEYLQEKKEKEVDEHEVD